MVGVSLMAQIADRLAGFSLRRMHKRGNTVFPKYIYKAISLIFVCFFCVWSMVCETFFSVKNFCVEGHATEV